MIVINGVVLSDGARITLWVALQQFVSDLRGPRLPPSIVGEEIHAGYLMQCAALQKLLIEGDALGRTEAS